MSDELPKSQIAAVAAIGRAEHPDIAIDETAFSGYIAQRLDADSPDGGLARLAAGDLCVAFAAIHGDPAAIRWIDGEVIAEVRPALAAMGLTAQAIDELVQELRDGLFVGATPKLASYAGRSSLRRWVRSVAVRMALNAQRGRACEVSLEDVLSGELERAATDPASEHLKALYRAQLGRSLRDALRSLSPRERNALHLHHVEGVTLDQLATHYNVHRATVARWLAASREALVTRTLDDVGQRLGLDRAEAESVLRLVISRLDITLDPS